MRTVVVALLTGFDFEFAAVKGECSAETTDERKKELWDGTKEYENDLRDSYVMMKGSLWVKVLRRAMGPHAA